MNINTEAEPRWVQNKDRILHSFFVLLRIFVILLYVYIVLYVILRDDDGEFEDSRSEWCEEFHPNLTFNECSDVAGW